ARSRSPRLSRRGLSEGKGKEGTTSLVVVAEEELVGAQLGAEQAPEIPHRAVLADQLEADRALVEADRLFELVVLVAGDALHGGTGGVYHAPRGRTPARSVVHWRGSGCLR